MEFNQENFNTLMAENKVFRANRETLSARNENLVAELERKATALEATEQKLAEANAVLAKAEAKSEEVEIRVTEAISCGVDATTALAMLKAEDGVSASKLANEFRASKGASGQADANTKAEANAWADFENKEQ
jgi:hypothetical protein